MGPGIRIDKVLERVRQAAASDCSILIRGEAGTGKELLARAIHRVSARRGKPFIALDCGAMAGSLVEAELFGSEPGAGTGADRGRAGHLRLADGGTLFLDEVVRLPGTAQAKLLRTLLEGQVEPLGSREPVPLDVRIVASCDVTLERQVLAGRFRRDLFDRLGECTVTLPPLRERAEDILHLAGRFLVEAGMEFRRPVRGFAEEAVRCLLRYPWPGNVRELRNVIRRAVLLGADRVGPEHLPGRFSGDH